MRGTSRDDDRAWQVEPASTALLRAAAWPVETLEAFAAPGLTVLAARVAARARAVAARRPALLARLHAAVPLLAEPAARHRLLAVRRAVGRGDEPWGAVPVAEDRHLAELLALDAADRAELARARAEFVGAYAAETDRQRLALWRITHESRFAKALVLAHPEVARRWAGAPAVAPADKRRRRVEDTVLRYLLRAVGRPTPAGAWAGVAAVRPITDGAARAASGTTPALVVEPAEPVLRVCPSVLPFARMLAGLACRPTYAGRAAPRLPARAACAWTALETAGAGLAETDAAVWFAGLRRLRATCAELGSRYHASTPMEIGALAAEAEAEIRRLWTWAGLPDRPTGDLLVASLRLPWRVRWNDELRRATGRAIGHLLARHAADGTAEHERRGSLGELLRAGIGVGPGGDFGLGPGRAGTGSGTATGSATATGSGTATGTGIDSESGVVDAEVGAWGAVLVRVTATGVVWVGGGIPYVLPFAGLHGALLAEEGETAPPTASDWLRAALPVGVRAIEVVGRDAANPDAALHPPLTDLVADPWGVDGAGPRDLTVTLDAGLRPWLRRAGDRELLVPVYGSCAVIGGRDPRGRRMLALAAAHGWDLTRRHPPTPVPVRLDTDAHPDAHPHASVYPRVTCHDGTVLAPRRYRIACGAPTESAAERYLAWRRAIDTLGVADLAYIRTAPGTPELLIRTDSPLVLRTVLDRLPAGTAWLELTEPAGPPDRWPLTDDAGRHYASELAVDWIRPAHRREPPQPRDGGP
ncbi:lantibiotic dehydratase [Embleya sp. NPDC001921]